MAQTILLIVDKIKSIKASAYSFCYTKNMENEPKPSQLSWQDISVEMIHELIADDLLVNARLAAAIRLEALQQICKDTDDAIEKNEGDVTIEQWLQEKKEIGREMNELAAIIQTIDADTR